MKILTFLYENSFINENNDNYVKNSSIDEFFT